jgi:hypothetical protein
MSKDIKYNEEIKNNCLFKNVCKADICETCERLAQELEQRWRSLSESLKRANTSLSQHEKELQFILLYQEDVADE